MSKPIHNAELQILLVKKYLSGEGSYRSLTAVHGISERSLRRWVLQYREQGENSFYRKEGNRHYSKEFKQQCVNAVLNGEGSVNDIVAKYNISSESVLRRWIMKYNANMELKDYEPKREVYMAEVRKKTTQEERKNIVDYCISHNNDYKGAAIRYEVS